ncbi:MAG: hypothetical protein Q9171_002828 [Xanthocarpia ochracea]
MAGESLRVLLVGNGGREHALAWKLSQSPRLEKLYVAPGNGGTSQVAKTENVPYLKYKPENFVDLLKFARESRINLVVIGPEAPLVEGIEQTFRTAGIEFYGPTKAAAQLEASKTWAKDFMARHSIPTAKYRNFKDYDKARQYLVEVAYDVVIKCTGIAAGKGVVLPSSRDEAQEALKEIMLDKKFGSAGDEVVIEEFLTGQELSFLSFVDGYTIKSLVPAQDHKQVFDNDLGPNTGGMGCYAPAPIADAKLIEEVHRTILQPTVDGMRKERIPFKGLLFTGIMVTPEGPKTLEYNTRFGDPETETLLPLLENDLIEVLLACTGSYLDTIDVKCKPGYSVTVVAAAGGYPDSYKTGNTVSISSSSIDDTYIFHAGTSMDSGTLKTAGGRVITATAVSQSLRTSVDRAYEVLSTIHFEGMHFRKDIAHRALSPKASDPPPSDPSFSDPKDGLTYADAGVSIDQGNSFVSLINRPVASTRRPGASADVGGFGGTFSLHEAGFPGAPTLVAGTDGVGTKLKIAHRMNKHDTIGIDLVAMCVNDVVVMGAAPLFFLDTFSCHKLAPEVALDVVKGIVSGCKSAGAALVGGETAEMGDIYRPGEYDLVGFTVGAIAHGRKVLPDKEAMKQGDVLLGLASDGLHSNGFSLVQKIVERAGLGYTDPAPWEEEDDRDGSNAVGKSLLRPTRIYVSSLLAAIDQNLIKGAAHITGGGLVDNVPRVLPKNLTAEIDARSWEVPNVFRWLKKAGGVEKEEMNRVFNMGIGMVVVAAEEYMVQVREVLEGKGEKVMSIGRLVQRGEGGEGCVITGMEGWDEGRG